jgi:integrase
MPRQAKPLTDTQIRNAKIGSKPLYDGHGLQLRVSASGTKSWTFNYSVPFSKRRTNIGIGTYPAIKLTQARKLREQYAELLAADVDPAEYRKEQAKLNTVAQVNTFGMAYAKWIESKEGEWSPSYKKRLQNALELHILPSLGNTPLYKINAPDTIAILSPLAERRAFESIRKLCRWSNEIMVFSVNSGLILANPLAGIRKAFRRPTVENRPSIKPNELPKFMSDLEVAGVTITTRCLIHWLLHTMARPIEGASARWDEIDLAKGVWAIPAEKMKKRRPHVVPLSSQAIEILEIMKPISAHRGYIFPSRSAPLKHTNSSTANVALKRMGYTGKQVAHGFRALASTILNEQEFPRELIEVAQSRVADGTAVATIYNRAEYIEQRRVMVQWWSDHIEEAASGISSSKGKKHLKVVQTV